VQQSAVKNARASRMNPEMTLCQPREVKNRC
jgi:hypothetical protein